MYTIYRIRNEINNKSYIGYTIEFYKTRFVRHKYAAKRGLDTYLCKAMRKYGIENFSIEVLCWGEDHKVGLNQVEPLMIELFSHEYNMTNGGEGSPGRILTDETKQKLRIASTGYVRSLESRAKQSISATGKQKGPHSLQTRMKIREKKLGRRLSPEHCKALSFGQKGRVHSPECRAKLSAAKIGVMQPLVSCVYCRKSGGLNTMPRYHFSNCKEKI